MHAANGAHPPLCSRKPTLRVKGLEGDADLTRREVLLAIIPGIDLRRSVLHACHFLVLDDPMDGCEQFKPERSLESFNQLPDTVKAVNRLLIAIEERFSVLHCESAPQWDPLQINLSDLN